VARYAALTALASAALVLSACFPAAEEGARRQRWIEQPTEDLLEIEDLVELDAPREWRFNRELRPGRFENSSILESGNEDELPVRPSGGVPRWRPDEADAAADVAAFSAVEVRLSGLERGKISVVWERGGVEIGRKSLDRLWARGERRDRFLFDLEGQIPRDSGRPSPSS